MSATTTAIRPTDLQTSCCPSRHPLVCINSAKLLQHFAVDSFLPENGPFGSWALCMSGGHVQVLVPVVPHKAAAEGSKIGNL